MGGWFLKENKHKTLRFTVFYAPEGSETLTPSDAHFLLLNPGRLWNASFFIF